MVYTYTMNPRLLRNLGYAAGALAILGLVIWYMATHPAPTNPTAELPGAGDQGIESSQPAYIEDSGTYYRLKATYPTNITFPLSSRSDAGVVAEQVMKAWVESTISEFKGTVAENQAFIDEITAKGEEVPASFSNMELAIEYETKTSPRTITYLFRSASYTGGAHGLEVPVTFTFDRTTGTQVKLADLFTSGYLARLSAIARMDLPGIVGEYKNDTFIQDGTAPTDDNFQTFYLEGDTLVILFPPYQVAPYVVGTVPLPIELSRLNTILKPEFQVQ